MPTTRSTRYLIPEQRKKRVLNYRGATRPPVRPTRRSVQSGSSGGCGHMLATQGRVSPFPIRWHGRFSQSSRNAPAHDKWHRNSSHHRPPRCQCTWFCWAISMTEPTPFSSTISFPSGVMKVIFAMMDSVKQSDVIWQLTSARILSCRYE